MSYPQLSRVIHWLALSATSRLIRSARVTIATHAVLTEREETASVAIASNESFSGWTKTFTDPRLCAAIVDRLTFAGNIETGTGSYRRAHTRPTRNGTVSRHRMEAAK